MQMSQPSCLFGQSDFHIKPFEEFSFIHGAEHTSLTTLLVNDNRFSDPANGSYCVGGSTPLQTHRPFRNDGVGGGFGSGLLGPAGCFDKFELRVLCVRLGLKARERSLKPNPKPKPWFRKGPSANAQNYVYNGNLPVKFATTQRSKVSPVNNWSYNVILIGRDLWVIAIAGNKPDAIVPRRPDVKFIGNMHGNEVSGYTDDWVDWDQVD